MPQYGTELPFPSCLFDKELASRVQHWPSQLTEWSWAPRVYWLAFKFRIRGWSSSLFLLEPRECTVLVMEDVSPHISVICCCLRESHWTPNNTMSEKSFNKHKWLGVHSSNHAFILDLPVRTIWYPCLRSWCCIYIIPNQGYSEGRCGQIWIF